MLRFLLILVWGSIILLLTAVSDFSSLIAGHPHMMFDWNTRPIFAQIFEFPKSLTEGYIIQKFGHVACFLVLACLAPSSSLKNFTWLILFACLTELLQLFTGRSGRLLDVGYDIIGICLGMIVAKQPARAAKMYPDFTR